MRIGLAVSIGGPRTYFRSAFMNAIDLLTHHGADFIVVDDQASECTARLCADAMVAAGVDVVVGHFNSTAASAAAPIYGQHGIPLVLPACTINAIEGAGRLIRLSPIDQLQMEAIAQAIEGTGETTCWIYVEGHGYADRLLGDLEASLHARRVSTEVIRDASLALSSPQQIHVLLGHAPWIAHWVERNASRLRGQHLITCDEGGVSFVRECIEQLNVVTFAFPSPSTAYPDLLAQAVGLLSAQPDGDTLEERLCQLEVLGRLNPWCMCYHTQTKIPT